MGKWTLNGAAQHAPPAAALARRHGGRRASLPGSGTASRTKASGARLNALAASVMLALTSTLLPIGKKLPAQADPPQDVVRQILDLSGLHGGLAVHYGCGDGGLILALGREHSWVVQGLSRDPEQVDHCRRAIESQRPAGKVTVRLWQEDFLPYADNLVNLFIGERQSMPPMAEVMRVLAPHGVACIKDPDGWHTTVKPWPDDMDEWTHWLHAADGNPVADDRRAAPPRSIQWIATPNRAKSHDAPPSLMGMVTAQGRLFYIADLSPPAIGDPAYEFDSWYLCARDAFNGIMLWKLPIEDWGNRAWSPGKLPAHPKAPWAGRAYGGLGPWISNPYVIQPGKSCARSRARPLPTRWWPAMVCCLSLSTGRRSARGTMCRRPRKACWPSNWIRERCCGSAGD